MNRRLPLLLLLLLSVELANTGYDVHTKEEVSLPMVFARPLDVDPNLDCLIKELAWNYANKLLPQVRMYV